MYQIWRRCFLFKMTSLLCELGLIPAKAMKLLINNNEWKSCINLSLQVFPSLRLDPRYIVLIPGTTFQLKATGGPYPQVTTLFSIKNETVAEVNSVGLITARTPGKSTIAAAVVATDPQSSHTTVFSKVSHSCRITFIFYCWHVYSCCLTSLLFNFCMYRCFILNSCCFYFYYMRCNWALDWAVYIVNHIWRRMF